MMGVFEGLIVLQNITAGYYTRWYNLSHEELQLGLGKMQAMVAVTEILELHAC